MVGLVSAAGLVGFLSEPDRELQVFALKASNENIGLIWTELAEIVSQIEALYEDEGFPERELAALVASKIYYHLQEYDESMSFALGAGKLFDIEREGEYEDTIIARCIDSYIALSASQNANPQATTSTDRSSSQLFGGQQANGSANTAASMQSPITPFSQSSLPSRSLLSRQDSTTADTTAQQVSQIPSNIINMPQITQQRLQAVIRRIFEKCFQEGAYRQVVGIAVEARNLDVIRETITRATEDNQKIGKQRAKDTQGRSEELLDYLLDICMNVIQERNLRNAISQLILDMLVSNSVASPDYFSIAKCIVYLSEHSMASNMLQRLVERGDPKSLAVAYQISFDIYDNSTQEFLTKVIEGLPETEEEKSEFENANGHAAGSGQDDAQETDPLLSRLEETAVTSTVVSRPKANPASEEQKKAYASIKEILVGTKSLELNLEFLYRTSKTDQQVLSKLKNSLEARNSIFHSAVTFANGFMNSGTTRDSFIRENLDWLGKAVNWSKFSVTASLGIIHRGNIGQGQKLLEPYLKELTPSGSGSPYAKGGALFALGLIYTNHGKHVVEYLHNQLRNNQQDEIVQHGAALGLGVAGMATESEAVVDDLKSALWSDSAVSGQAAGLGIGLVLLGSGNVKALEDLIAYAHETEHDKTVRGIALGMALIMYGRQEAADELINGLLDDPDPTLRYGGVMTIALAYCGTGSNKAVRKLLHLAVSDVNDDVRRNAVMSLGFVLFRKPGSVPRMVELLAESYNPHVRYGATMALGIACAGTGLEEAVDLLEPMMKDSTDFVRQGALIALSMIMVQQSEVMNSKVTTIRKHLLKVIGDRHEDAMAKFGGAIALGIIDAGGRNCSIGLQTQTGNLNMAAIVGMAIFTQYWYWFPLTHFLALSFTPTTVIAVDQDLEVPVLKLHCAARPSTFDYPPPMEVKTEEAPEKVKTAVLSTTAQAKRRKMAKERQHRSDTMDIEQSPTTPKVSGAEDDKMDTDEDGKERDDKATDERSGEEKAKDGEAANLKSSKAKIEREKIGYDLDNMSRVIPPQLKYISFQDGRYVPVKRPTGGVVVTIDNKPSETKSLIERQIKKTVPRAAPSANQRPGQPSTTSIATESNLVSPGDLSAADIAGILTAVDEDEDDSPVPGEFEYHTDDEGGSDSK